MSKKRLKQLEKKILKDKKLSNEEKVMLLIFNDSCYYINQLIEHIESGKVNGKI